MSFPDLAILQSEYTGCDLEDIRHQAFDSVQMTQHAAAA